MLVKLSDDSIAVLICYDNPLFEEEEQELPFLRWRRYVNIDEEERYIEKMTLIIISVSNPIVRHGSVHWKKEKAGENSLWFRDVLGEKVLLSLQEDLNDSIEKQFECQGQLSAVPIWNGKEIMLGRLSMLDHEEDVSGKVFVQEWIGVLAVSLFHVTKAFLNMICNAGGKMDQSEEEQVPQNSARKSPKPNRKLVWIWWPPIKPRNLGVYLREMGARKSISMAHFRANPPIISGVYRGSFAQVTTHGEKSWVLKIHADRDASIPVFFDPDIDHIDTSDQEKTEYEPDSEEVRVIFNRNFILNYGFKQGTNVSGIFGSLSYITAQILPYRKDNVCPMFPCLSPWASLHNFKESVADIDEIPGPIDGILSRASRLRELLGEVLRSVGDEDLIYFQR